MAVNNLIGASVKVLSPERTLALDFIDLYSLGIKFKLYSTHVIFLLYVPSHLSNGL